MHRFCFRVRYADTDQMGFAYYANYLRWFEVGRAELIRDLGSSYRAIEDAGVALPVVEARCHYLKPARYDDLLAVETGLLKLGRASVSFGYRVAREGEEDGGNPSRPHSDRRVGPRRGSAREKPCSLRSRASARIRIAPIHRRRRGRPATRSAARSTPSPRSTGGAGPRNTPMPA